MSEDLSWESLERGSPSAQSCDLVDRDHSYFVFLSDMDDVVLSARTALVLIYQVG
jgi:hypothetical protein